MLILDDTRVCPQCGAFFQGDGRCANGHPQENACGLEIEPHRERNPIKPIGICLGDEQIEELVGVLMDALDLAIEPPAAHVDRHTLADRLEYWAAVLSGEAGEFDPELLSEGQESNISTPKPAGIAYDDWL